MRYAILTAALLVAIFTSQALATHGGGGGSGGNLKYTTINVVNKCDAAVEVSANNAQFATLEPKETVTFNMLASKGSTIEVSVTATLAGTAITMTQTATVAGEKKTTATITAPTADSLAINFSGLGLVAANLHREAAIVIASTGGLLPALAIVLLLGRSRKSS
jgi:hypothetical protein